MGMRRIVAGLGTAALIVLSGSIAGAAGASGPAGPAAAPDDTVARVLTDLGTGVRACGATATAVGTGWNLYWTNCWGTTPRPVAPVWFNGVGNTYTNVRNVNGANLCAPNPAGGTVGWYIPASDLPPEPTNYTGVIMCMRY